ncbi:MAG: hypothetical protein JWO72_2454 [Caulobacteraceae bacterium]|nr:hypothetical protein [Caulobacteraceae bacterium]
MVKSVALIFALLAVAGAAHAQADPARLHDALHLSAPQQEAWRTYQQAIAVDPQAQARAQQAQTLMPQIPTPRRLALIRAQMQADLQTFERDAAAVNAFYAALTPEQQRIFDSETATAPAQH